jgi:chromosome segregation ATPase
MRKSLLKMDDEGQDASPCPARANWGAWKVKVLIFMAAVIGAGLSFPHLNDSQEIADAKAQDLNPVETAAPGTTDPVRRSPELEMARKRFLEAKESYQQQMAEIRAEEAGFQVKLNDARRAIEAVAVELRDTRAAYESTVETMRRMNPESPDRSLSGDRYTDARDRATSLKNRFNALQDEYRQKRSVLDDLEREFRTTQDARSHLEVLRHELENAEKSYEKLMDAGIEAPSDGVADFSSVPAPAD